MDRRLAHAGSHSHFAPRRRFRFTALRPIVLAIASLHRWRRQILKVWSPVDSLSGTVLMGLMAASCWIWWQLGKLLAAMLAF